MAGIEFIPKAGACLATTNVMSRRGLVRWMLRKPSQSPVDNGWRIMSSIDTSVYLSDQSNWQIVDFNDVCMLQPALIGIWDLPVGSDLEIVDDELGTRVVEVRTGRPIPEAELYVPPQWSVPLGYQYFADGDRMVFRCADGASPLAPDTTFEAFQYRVLRWEKLRSNTIGRGIISGDYTEVSPSQVADVVHNIVETTRQREETTR